MLGLGWWSTIKYGVIGLLVVFVATLGWSFVNNYTKMATEIAELKAEVKKFDGRVASYKRMIERRDAAIDASDCKAQIRKWVSAPDSIPQKFDPFNNSPLAPPNPQGQPNRQDSEPVLPPQLPDFSKVLPWNWGLW
jgi:hypothetical protein